MRPRLTIVARGGANRGETEQTLARGATPQMCGGERIDAVDWSSGSRCHGTPHSDRVIVRAPRPSRTLTPPRIPYVIIDGIVDGIRNRCPRNVLRILTSMYTETSIRLRVKSTPISSYFGVSWEKQRLDGHAQLERISLLQYVSRRAEASLKRTTPNFRRISLRERIHLRNA